MIGEASRSRGRKLRLSAAMVVALLIGVGLNTVVSTQGGRGGNGPADPAIDFSSRDPYLPSTPQEEAVMTLSHSLQ